MTRTVTACVTFDIWLAAMTAATPRPKQMMCGRYVSEGIQRSFSMLDRNATFAAVYGGYRLLHMQRLPMKWVSKHPNVIWDIVDNGSVENAHFTINDYDAKY